MKKRTIIYAVSTVLCLILLLSCAVGCNEKEDDIDYGKDNSYSVKTIDDDDALIFEPKTDADIKYGLIFYVGTGISPSQYSYLGNSLAKQGYVVVIPKTQNDMPLQYYTQSECAFEKYPSVQFFIAGHSNQGAGACVKRSNDCENDILGSILIAPILASTPVVDADDNTVTDNDGNGLTRVNESLCNFTKPVLLVDAKEDKVRTSQQISDVLSALPASYTHKTIENASHISFCQIDSKEQLTIKEIIWAPYEDDFNANTIEQKNDQRTLTAFYILEFMRDTISQ